MQQPMPHEQHRHQQYPPLDHLPHAGHDHSGQQAPPWSQQPHAAQMQPRHPPMPSNELAPRAPMSQPPAPVQPPAAVAPPGAASPAAVQLAQLPPAAEAYDAAMPYYLQNQQQPLPERAHAHPQSQPEPGMRRAYVRARTRAHIRACSTHDVRLSQGSQGCQDDSR